MLPHHVPLEAATLGARKSTAQCVAREWALPSVFLQVPFEMAALRARVPAALHVAGIWALTSVQAHVRR